MYIYLQDNSEQNAGLTGRGKLKFKEPTASNIQVCQSNMVGDSTSTSRPSVCSKSALSVFLSCIIKTKQNQLKQEMLHMHA